MLRNISVILCFTALCLAACNRSDKKNIRDFYFPLKQLKEGTVYAYESLQNDSLIDTTYWYYRSFISDSAIFLTGTYYGSFPEPQQFVREEMVRNGMLLNDMYLYVSDSTGKQQPVPTTILSGSVFPFEVSDSGGVFLYKVQFAFPTNSTDTITLIKNRRYLGDTTYTVQNELAQAVVFDLRELIESGNSQQGYVEPRYGGKEIYAKGKGLVYSEKQVNAELKLANRLVFTCTMEALEDIFKKKYPQAMMKKPD